MEVKLVQRSATLISGEDVLLGQWYVSVDGVAVGFLAMDEGSNILPLVPMMSFSEADQLKIAEECSKIAEFKVGPAIPFYVPPQQEQQLLEEDGDEE